MVVIAKWLIFVCLLFTYGVSEAQVSQGTVFSKTEDGNGNKITSTISGPSRGLDVNCLLGCGAGGATYLDADGIVNQTAGAVHGQTYMYNGATWDRVRGAILTGLEVNCITGCAGGATTPSDAFANPATAGLQFSFLAGWNGATWDRLRSSIAGGLDVNIKNASVAVTNAGLTNLDVLLSTRASEATLANMLTAVQFQARINTLGQKTMANSTPMVLASDQTSIPVAATVTNSFLLDATFTGRFVAATLDADALVNETTTAVHGKCYLYNGASWDRCRGTTAAGLLVNVNNAFLLDATFTARINTLGQKTMANSTPVVLASDQTSIPVSATVTNSFLLDATFTGRFAAAYVDADTIANQTTTAMHGQLYGYNGATWDRLRSTIAGGLLVDVSDAFLLDATFTTRINTQGQKTMAASTPVVLPSDQAAIPVTLTSTTITGTVTVAGAKSNNAVVPGATNLGVLPCVVTTAAPVLTDTFQAGCSLNPSGGARTDITQLLGVAPSVTNPFPMRESNGTSFFSSDTIGANIYKKVSMVQDIEVSSTNSSTANLNAGITFTGTSQTTLGVGSIQVNFFADQNATIQVQQAQEDPGVNWNIVDSWTYTANSTGNDAARTIQATGSAARVLATNNGAVPTTALRLQTIVCPVCDTLPRGLTQKGNMKVSIEEQATVTSANNDGSCASGAASFTALASNTSRTWAAIWASPANTDDVYIKLGATATNADARFSPGQALNITSGKIYTGIIDAFPASGTQAVCVMELN